MKIKNKILSGMAGIATIATPIATVVACAPSSGAYAFVLAVPTPEKASASNTATLNDVTGPIIQKYLNEHGYKGKVSFSLSANNIVAANMIKSGKAKAGDLPSHILGEYKDSLDIAFLAARAPMMFNNVIDKSDAKMSDVNGVYLTEMNKTYASIVKTGAYDKSKSYKLNAKNSELADFYRAEIYFDDPAAKTAWDKATTAKNATEKLEALKEFMATGVITHSSSSESGYIVPQRMIRNHFDNQKFNLTDAEYSTHLKIGGTLSQLTTTAYGVYFSFAGEALQNTEFARVKTLVGDGTKTHIHALALSAPIPNNGFAVKKGTSKKEQEAIMKAFIELVTKNKHNMMKSLYYETMYRVPSASTLKLIYGKFK